VLQAPLPRANSSASKPPLSWSRPAVILPPRLPPSWPSAFHRREGLSNAAHPRKNPFRAGPRTSLSSDRALTEGSHGGKSRDNGGGRLLSEGAGIRDANLPRSVVKRGFSAVLQQGFDRTPRDSLPLRVCSSFPIGFDRSPLPFLRSRDPRKLAQTRSRRGSRVSLSPSAPPPLAGDSLLLSDPNDGRAVRPFMEKSRYRPESRGPLIIPPSSLLAMFVYSVDKRCDKGRIARTRSLGLEP